MKVNNRVRYYRDIKGITQNKMAIDLNVSRQTIVAIENKKYNPSLELALKIVKYLALPIDELFWLEGDIE
ncbi:helix-turn-helix transcriptional regulator [Bacillus cereus]|uniref:helix-turn-helix transcriptional regulator n=1 Tax=Bacillus cereus TaxID=1396 RepID=UPI000BEE7366|nr:helix-turn-helix transcriptional regulator [Bacillus cereus]PDY73541.1 transcriptional regulator [Bacillus cereus]PEC90976.1 transcriptional regulator [Bacillus cereus]PET80849.1 transcriptional regulator [Bacillus cereus]PEX66773.1 transcriptional regulator [Bacillus cereus]PFI88676.1 transcriptional regulator [Bacillus cereus]